MDRADMIAPTPGAEVDLAEAARQINEAHRECADAVTAAVPHALRVGELLLQVKKRVRRGRWRAWVRGNCAFSSRTCWAYMRLARVLPCLGVAKAQQVARLPVWDAVRELAGADTAPR
jgi:hypothetical protein